MNWWYIVYAVIGYGIPMGLGMTDHSPTRSIIFGCIATFTLTVIYHITKIGGMTTKTFYLTAKRRLRSMFIVLPIMAVTAFVFRGHLDQQTVVCCFMVPYCILMLECVLYALIGVIGDAKEEPLF